MNKVILIGNVGNDPDIRNTQSGQKIANFSIATSERWTDKRTGEKVEKTEWHKIVIFNENLVELVEKYVTKGMKLYIEGQLQTRKWTDKDGADRYSTEIVLQNYRGEIQFLSSKQDSQQADNQAPNNSPQAQSGVVDGLDDEVPF